MNDLNASIARVKNHNYQNELRGCMHRGFMPIYHRTISKYRRPLVERLKIRLAVNFVDGNSQTVYNSEGYHTIKLDMKVMNSPHGSF